MIYNYKDPAESGFKKIKLTRRQHNYLFKYRPRKWYQRVEYYISPEKFRMEIYTGRVAIFLIVALFPVNFLMAGLSNIGELLRDYKRLLNERGCGAFICDECWSNTDMYEEISRIINT